MADSSKAYPLVLLRAEEEILLNQKHRRFYEVKKRLEELAETKLKDWSLSLIGYTMVHILGQGGRILAVAQHNSNNDATITWYLP